MKIIIVDRHASSAELLRVTLSSRGYPTIVVEDAKDGLAAVRAHWPDVVILDHDVPGFPAGQFIKTTRTIVPDVDILLLSESPNIADIAQGLSVRYVSKPCHPTHVLGLLPAVAKH